ncbi:MAG: DUF6597 domain-containing transcriptional factor [Actinomycetota bacterium]
MERIDVSRHAARPPLDRFVDRFWYASWALPEGAVVRPQIVGRPVVNLTFQDGRATVTGVSRQLFRRELRGQGEVLGVVFRPACFHPFLDRPLHMIANRNVDCAELFGKAGADWAQAVHEAPTVEAKLNEVHRFLVNRAPRERTAGEALADALDALDDEQGLPSVRELRASLGLGSRQLERLFRHYVGASPKWVVRRWHEYRIPPTPNPYASPGAPVNVESPPQVPNGQSLNGGVITLG